MVFLRKANGYGGVIVVEASLHVKGQAQVT
jgi:hypothetical protein